MKYYGAIRADQNLSLDFGSMNIDDNNDMNMLCGYFQVVLVKVNQLWILMSHGKAQVRVFHPMILVPHWMSIDLICSHQID